MRITIISVSVCPAEAFYLDVFRRTAERKCNQHRQAKT
jgi:hypothetical protein